MKHLKYKNKKTIEVQDWDDLVQETYDKPYRFQQQDGCKSRGSFELTIPEEDEWIQDIEDRMNSSIPEVVNGEEKMGVKFDVWLARDPEQHLKDEPDNRQDQWLIDLFWERNFYPSIYTVANDLYKRGLIEKGEYTINIDW